MGSPDYLTDAVARRWRRIRYAVAAAFGAVFFFALLVQAMADFAGWATSTRVIFLLPRGLSGVFGDTARLVSVVFGLSLVSLAVAGLFYWRMWRVEEQSGLFLSSLPEDE